MISTVTIDFECVGDMHITRDDERKVASTISALSYLSNLHLRSVVLVKPKPVAIEAPKVAVEEAVKKAVASGEASSLPMMIMAGFSVLQIARYNFLNPTKDAGGAVAYSIDADGKMEKLEAEEEAEFELPKEFENPE